MLSALRERFAAGKAFIRTYQAGLDARVEDREAKLREALGSYARALDTGARARRAPEKEKTEQPAEPRSDAMASAEKSLAALGPTVVSPEQDLARFTIDQALRHPRRPKVGSAGDQAAQAELSALIGNADKPGGDDIYAACLANKGIKETRWSVEGLAPDALAPGQREALSAQALAKTRNCMEHLLVRETATLEAASPGREPESRRALQAALESRHAYARDLLAGYERGLRFAIERYGR